LGQQRQEQEPASPQLNEPEPQRQEDAEEEQEDAVQFNEDMYQKKHKQNHQ